jgi:hypothetical protein
MEVPPPFELDVELAGSDYSDSFVAFGTLTAASHPLSGWWIRLSRNNKDGDGVCVVAAFSEPPVTGCPELNMDIIAGLASIEVLSAS